MATDADVCGNLLGAKILPKTYPIFWRAYVLLDMRWTHASAVGAVQWGLQQVLQVQSVVAAIAAAERCRAETVAEVQKVGQQQEPVAAGEP